MEIFKPFSPRSQKPQSRLGRVICAAFLLAYWGQAVKLRAEDFFEVKIVGLINERPVTNVDLYLFAEFCKPVDCHFLGNASVPVRWEDLWMIMTAAESSLGTEIGLELQKASPSFWAEVLGKLPTGLQKVPHLEQQFQVFWQGYQIFTHYRERLIQPIDQQEIQDLYLSDARWQNKGSLLQTQEEIRAFLSESRGRKNWEAWLKLHSPQLKIKRFNDLEGRVDP